MSRAFSIARAIAIMDCGWVKKGDILCGHYEPYFNEILAYPDDISEYQGVHSDVERSEIDPSTLTFNTGFKDKNGDEIFTGDYVESYVCPTALVIFDEDEGAFFFTYTSSFIEKSHDGVPTEFATVQKTYFHRFNKEIAAQCRVVGNIYEKQLKAGNEVET